MVFRMTSKQKLYGFFRVNYKKANIFAAQWIKVSDHLQRFWSVYQVFLTEFLRSCRPKCLFWTVKISNPFLLSVQSYEVLKNPRFLEKPPVFCSSLSKSGKRKNCVIWVKFEELTECIMWFALKWHLSPNLCSKLWIFEKNSYLGEIMHFLH